MYTDNNGRTWNQYLETTCRGGSPVKLDRILKRRMRAFMKARQAIINESVIV